MRYSFINSSVKSYKPLLPFRGEEGNIFAYSYILQSKFNPLRDCSKWHERQHKKLCASGFWLYSHPSQTADLIFSTYQWQPLTRVIEDCSTATTMIMWYLKWCWNLTYGLMYCNFFYQNKTRMTYHSQFCSGCATECLRQQFCEWDRPFRGLLSRHYRASDAEPLSQSLCQQKIMGYKRHYCSHLMLL